MERVMTKVIESRFHPSTPAAFILARVFRYNPRPYHNPISVCRLLYLRKVMVQSLIEKARRKVRVKLWLCAALALFSCACAATPPPDASSPRPNEPRYPVSMVESTDRQQAALAGWEKLTNEQGIARPPAPELQPVTASLRSLPALPMPLYLPKVGDNTAQSKQQLGDDATTESLRRFINDNARLFGVDPQQLSLILLTDAADGTRKAKYQQRPFRYPIRGGFGELEISFTADRRILQITSTCIPEIEQLQRAGAGIRPKLSADEVARRMIGRSFTYTAAAGNTETRSIETSDVVTVHELVVYPVLRPGQDALDFHLAWEVLVGREQKRAVYVDAITDEIIAATPV